MHRVWHEVEMLAQRIVRESRIARERFNPGFAIPPAWKEQLRGVQDRIEFGDNANDIRRDLEHLLHKLTRIQEGFFSRCEVFFANRLRAALGKDVLTDNEQTHLDRVFREIQGLVEQAHGIDLDRAGELYREAYTVIDSIAVVRGHDAGNRSGIVIDEAEDRRCGTMSTSEDLAERRRIVEILSAQPLWVPQRQEVRPPKKMSDVKTRGDR